MYWLNTLRCASASSANWLRRSKMLAEATTWLSSFMNLSRKIISNSRSSKHASRWPRMRLRLIKLGLWFLAKLTARMNHSSNSKEEASLSCWSTCFHLENLSLHPTNLIKPRWPHSLLRTSCKNASVSSGHTFSLPSSYPFLRTKEIPLIWFLIHHLHRSIPPGNTICLTQMVLSWI